MSELGTQLKTFLRARSLEEPDGRPLYGYRCSGTELETLERHLLDELSGRPAVIAPKTKQAFCLWAAEQYRRSYRGGAWSWNDVLARLDALYLAPEGPGYAQLCDMVVAGIREWKRGLLRNPHGRLFLITLVCEGGLPLYLVKREQARLRTFFRALFEEVRIHQYAGALKAGVSVQDLAKRVSHVLPASLRQDVVFELSGQLISKVWELLASVHDASDPLVALDVRNPGWRGELPLDLDDDVARAFLNGLVGEARAVAHGTRATITRSRFLSPIPTAGLVSDALDAEKSRFELSGRWELPAIIDANQLAGMFGDELPARFELCSAHENGQVEVLALGSKMAEGSTIRLESSTRALRPALGSPAAEGHRLLVRSAQGQRGPSLQFSGALALSPLPWIFVREDSADRDERYVFVGEGAHRVRHLQALVAVTDGCRIEPTSRGQFEHAGTIHGLDQPRIVFRVSGTVTLVSRTGDAWVVSTDDPMASDPADYRLSGRLLDVDQRTATTFCGMPDVVIVARSGVSSRVPARELEWCAARPGANWRAPDARSFGEGYLRHVSGGKVRFMTRLRALPPGFSVSFRPQNTTEGIIELGGVDGADVGVIPAQGVVASYQDIRQGVIALRLRASREVPKDVTLQLLWRDGGTLELTLPFPANVTGFISHGGQRIGSGASIAASRLAGLQAIALVPTRKNEFRVEGSYLPGRSGWTAHRRMPISCVMAESPQGMHSLDLGVLQNSVVSLLNSSEDLDCGVRLSICSSDLTNVQAQSILVRRYDLDFERGEDGSTVRIPAAMLVEHTSAEIAALRVEAVSLLQPSADPVPLERIGSAEWSVLSDALTPGPWLLVGWDGQWCRVRPRLHEVASGSTVIEPTTAASGLAQSCALQDSRPRREAIGEALRRMAVDPDHADWNVIEGYVRLCMALPPSSFDAMCALSELPEAAAMAALVVPETDTSTWQSLWHALRTLPFSWLSIPRGVWSDAIVRWLTPRREALDQFGDVGLEPAAMVDSHYFGPMMGRLTEDGRLPWLKPVFETARSLALGIAPSQQTNLVSTTQFADFAFGVYWDVIGRFPAAPVTGRDPVPRAFELFTRRQALKESDLKRLFVDRTKQRGLVSEGREAFLNAPAIGAFCAVDNIALDATAQVELRDAYEFDPSWFSDAYKWAYLHALSVRTHKREPRRIRVGRR